MKNSIISFLLLFWCLSMYSINDCFKGHNTDLQLACNVIIDKSVSLDISEIGTIFQLSIDAQYSFSDSYNSLIRVVLEDKCGSEYLVFEAYPVITEKSKDVITNYAAESMILDGIDAKLLHIYIRESTFNLNTINYCNIPFLSSYDDVDILRDNVKKEQIESLVETINSLNVKRGKLWKAAVNSLALTSFQTKQRMMGLSDDETSMGYEYYSTGLFDFGQIESNGDYCSSPVCNSASTELIDHFDWRNRHGKNWNSPVKNQGDSNYCWAFAPVATIEAYLNLFFNDTLNVDLSEQAVVLYSDYTQPLSVINNTGGQTYWALNYIRDTGVIDEQSCPFNGMISSSPNNSISIYNEKVQIVHYDSICPPDYNTAIKVSLMNHGPLVVDLFNGGNMGHSMSLVGYGTIHEGDRLCDIYNSQTIPSGSPYIGKTYWIFKNSYGTNFGESGYSNIVLDDHQILLKAYYIDGCINSTIRDNDDVICADFDGDGYYFWGIGPKPESCPNEAPDEPDGDDSNYYLGPMDEGGNLCDMRDYLNDIVYINRYTNIIKSGFIYSPITILNNAEIDINSEYITFYENVAIFVNDGILSLYGTMLNDADIRTNGHSKVDIVASVVNVRSNFSIKQGDSLYMEDSIIQ